MSREELIERMFFSLEDATIFGAYLDDFITEDDIRTIRAIMKKLEEQ